MTPILAKKYRQLYLNQEVHLESAFHFLHTVPKKVHLDEKVTFFGAFLKENLKFKIGFVFKIHNLDKKEVWNSVFLVVQSHEKQFP